MEEVEESVFFSTLTFDLPGVLALTRRSWVEMGHGCMTNGSEGLSLSKRASLVLWEPKAGWKRAEKIQVGKIGSIR